MPTVPVREGLLPRRTAAALVAIASLAAGGCSDGAADREADREAAPDGALTSDQVEEALLPTGSTVGEAEVGREDLPGLADDRQADRDECQPLSALVDLEPEPVRDARRVAEVKWGAWVHVQLLTYAAGDAERVLDQVDAAVDACADGYVDTRIREFPVSRVAREDGPDLGDDVVAYAMTATDSMETEPYPTVEHTVVVRDGQQLLAFRTDPAGDAADEAESRALLAAVVDAQWERYAAQR